MCTYHKSIDDNIHLQITIVLLYTVYIVHKSILMVCVQLHTFHSFSVGDEILNQLFCALLTTFHVIGGVLLVAVGQKFIQTTFRNHVYLLTKVRRQHGLHNGPNLAKPRRRIDNEEQSNSHWNLALKHLHKLQTIIDAEVFKRPFIHVRQECNSFGACLFFFNHGVHGVGEVVDDITGGGLLWEVATGHHVKDVMTFLRFETRNGEQCLGRELALQRFGSELEVTALKLLHDLPGSFFVELFGSR